MTSVMYIGGWGRSGTTIIDNVLGAHDGVFSAGELFHLWQRGLINGRRCGCGEPVRACALWREVLRVAYGDNPPDPRQMVVWQREVARARHTSRLLQRPHPLSDVTARLYRAIAEVTGARLIIDSSKVPSGAALLASMPGVTGYLLHVVRDPRAVAYSWQRPTRQLDLPRPALMRTHGPVDSTSHWVFWNLLVERAARAFEARYLRVRYEDFAAAPADVIGLMLALAGMSPASDPFEEPHRVRLGGNHTVSGNPSRFRAGLVELRADEAWRGELPGPSARAVTALAMPLLHRYGYPVRVDRAGAPAGVPG
ncbi:sulfotransferase [Luedemannella flava]